MIQKSIFISGETAALDLTKRHFNMLPEDFQIADGAEMSYDFLKNRRGGAFISSVSGDFSYAIDLFIFDETDAWLNQRLLDLSLEGVDVASPNEEKSGPFDNIIYRAGKTFAAEVMADEETGELRMKYNT